MSRGAMWTKHRPIALAIAREYHVPYMDADDLRQEALIALWHATGGYDPEKGPFGPFARLVISRRMIDLLKSAKASERRLIEFGQQLAIPIDPAEAQSRLGEVMDALPTLTDRERQALTEHLNGMPACSTKAHDNALTRARKKLRAA